MDSSFFEKGEQHLKFSIAHQRISPHEGDVKRLVMVYDRDNSANQLFAFKVGELTKTPTPLQVGRLKGVAPRAPQRALFGDFN
jgi:hypothetical protein